MLLILLFLVIRGQERFIKYFSDEQGIKMEEQILNDYNKVGKEFGIEKKSFGQVFVEGNAWNIFQYKNHDELIASVYLENHTFCGQAANRIFERKVVILYSIYVSERYRKLGYSKKLLKNSLEALDKHYKMNGDFLVVLHVDPKDKNMELAFSIYYNMNFRHGGFSDQDPYLKKYFLDELLQYEDPRDAISKSDKLRGSGRYMILFCEYHELDKCDKKYPYDELLEDGRRLKRIMKGEI